MAGAEGAINVLNSSIDKIYIGVVKKVAKIDGEQITDKIGTVLKPFEIIFSSGDLLVDCRATPLVVSTELLEGDAVMIYSMDSIYSSTFFYSPIRNMDSPRDTLRFKYGETQIDFKPNGGEVDLNISTGDNLISLNASKGTINIDASDGVLINTHGGTFDVKNERESLSSLMSELIEKIANLKVLTPNGDGITHPESMAELLTLSTRFDDLLQSTDENEYYKLPPDDPYSSKYAAEAVRELGLDFLNDEAPYVVGEDPKIDKLRSELPPDSNMPTLAPTAEILDNSVGNTRPIAANCPVGPYNDNTKLSPNLTLGNLSTKVTFPHKVRSQGGYSEAQIVCNLSNLAVNVIEPIRANFSHMRINSGFRSFTKGKSQHEKGQACDLQFTNRSPREYLEVAEWIKQNVEFDQMIFEHGKSIWIHLSYTTERKNRKQLLTMINNKYLPGIKCYY